MAKPFSQACENNKRPILEVLRRRFAGVRDVLEVGSGTGQHAVFFAAEMPHLHWQPSDRVENLDGIRAWVEEAALANVAAPLQLDVTAARWPVERIGAVFSANTTHIMSWPMVEAFFAGVGEVLAPGGVFALYGPFNYGGASTSDSNARFDEWLRQRDPDSGLRNFEDVDALARRHGLELLEDNAMPANNRLLVWQKGSLRPLRASA